MDIRKDPQFGDVVTALEESRGLPYGTLGALVGAESAGNPNARSSVGAQGLTQFMPGTAKQYNVDTANPWDSLRGTADYLHDLLGQYKGDIRAALAHYNGGAYNAQAEQSGQAPNASKVSPQNRQVNAKYVNDIHGKVEADPRNQVKQIEGMVSGLLSQGMPANVILGKLQQQGLGPTIDLGREKGYSADEIVRRIGGEQAERWFGTRDKIDGQNFAQNAVQGGTNAVGDIVRGTKQRYAEVTGNDADVQRLRDEQRAVEADPERQHLGHTAGGVVGEVGVKAVPYVAAGAVAPAGLLPAIAVQGAVGAADGALTPTTEDGQLGGNVLKSAALGAAGGAAGHVAGKAVNGMAGKVFRHDADATARVAAAQEHGLPVSVASASGEGGFWRNVSDKLPENGSIKAFRHQADEALGGKVAHRLGIDGYKGGIDSELLNAARGRIGGAMDAASGVDLVLPQSLTGELQALLTGGTNPLTEGIANNSVVKQAVVNLTKAVEAGRPINGATLQGLASELKGVVSSQGATHGEKQMASQLIDKINDALVGGMTPEQAAAYRTASGQYRNLKAAERMVKVSNDSGEVTPRQMLSSIKTGQNSSAFTKGDAPYQDLAKVAADLYGAGNGRGLGTVIGKAVGSGDMPFQAASVMSPVHGLPAYAGKKLTEVVLGKLAASQNPTLIRLLTGAGGKEIDPAMRAFIAKALTGGGAATGGSLGP